MCRCCDHLPPHRNGDPVCGCRCKASAPPDRRALVIRAAYRKRRRLARFRAAYQD